MKYIQHPQKAEFNIKIGEFDYPKYDYLSDPIQSFYKQFVSSEEALYFFKYEDKEEAELADAGVAWVLKANAGKKSKM